MAELALQQARVSETSAAAPTARPRPSPRLGADVAGPVGNQARLRRLSPAVAQPQARLEIGAADDPLEHEADAAAEAVIRMSSAAAPGGPPEQPEGECAACKAAAPVRRSAPAGGGSLAAPPIVHDALAAPGPALDAKARAPMEAAFGADFKAVRVHTDALADRSARAIGAHAYTLGADIVFAAGRYQPGWAAGQRLIAHELAHTLQQAGGGAVVHRMVATPSASDAAEVAGHLNSFCAGTATASGASVVPAAGACTTNTGAGCECACTAMQDPKRTYTISPVSCDVKLTKETMADGSSQTIPESSIWPTTSGPACAAAVQINIPKAGSTMEFGAFDAASKPNWYPTGRILAHELCGHGVLCQTYAGGTGDRQQHDSTIDTENLIAGPPARGHYKDLPRQGESFANKAGDRSKVAFVLKDGWHYEAP
jgi:hypothetical protein